MELNKPDIILSSGEKQKPKNPLYPVFLKLDKLDTLLIGAGNVGLEKLNSLLANAPDARITIVAPNIKEEVRELLRSHPSCVLHERIRGCMSRCG